VAEVSLDLARVVEVGDGHSWILMQRPKSALMVSRRQSANT
jgi:hypothetical protein